MVKWTLAAQLLGPLRATAARLVTLWLAQQQGSASLMESGPRQHQIVPVSET